MPPVDRSSPDLEDPRTYNLTSAEALAIDIHSVSNEVYNINFFAGYHDAKTCLHVTVYVLPKSRRRISYPVSAQTAYRHGYNLALMEKMMDWRLMETRPRWFGYYCKRLSDEI